MADTNSIRLNKYISESGICSRREADKFIENGNVTINDRKAKLGDVVFPKDKVRVNGHIIEAKASEDEIFILLNKPVGITSTTEANVKDNIIDYVNHSARIFPIGRLDKDSQGLIFLTNNGDIVNKILRAANNHEKEYLVTVNKPITDEFIESMASGVPILGVTTKKCLVKKESPFIFRIILIQGLNRQIRRMCEYFGYEVTKLERIRIMNISLKGLPLGEWREILPNEMEVILKLIGKSSSENKNSEKNKAKSSRETTKKSTEKKRTEPKNTEKSFPKKTTSQNSAPKNHAKTKTQAKAKPNSNASIYGKRNGKPTTKNSQKNTRNKSEGKGRK
jgi:23S rRNA pseudouridine2604 synthase